MKFTKFLTVCVLTMAGISAHASCSIGVGKLSFGQYNPFSEVNLYTSAHININCLVETEVLIKTVSLMDRNQLRTMRNIQYPEQTDVLAYQVFTNVSRDQLFGDGNNNTSYYSGSNKTFTLYGTLIKKQNVYKGIYQDNLILEINY